MATLALVQIIATYLMARNRHGVLLLPTAGLICFIALTGAFADAPLWVARRLATISDRRIGGQPGIGLAGSLADDAPARRMPGFASRVLIFG